MIEHVVDIARTITEAVEAVHRVVVRVHHKSTSGESGDLCSNESLILLLASDISGQDGQDITQRNHKLWSSS